MERDLQVMEREFKVMERDLQVLERDFKVMERRLFFRLPVRGLNPRPATLKAGDQLTELSGLVTS